jgi:hypothetical protein
MTLCPTTAPFLREPAEGSLRLQGPETKTAAITAQTLSAAAKLLAPMASAVLSMRLASSEQQQPGGNISRYRPRECRVRITPSQKRQKWRQGGVIVCFKPKRCEVQPCRPSLRRGIAISRRLRSA